VADAQLWLLPEPKPLHDRLGNDFFKKVPAIPGVYLMTDESERVLYVGQSCNLRRRLNSYKNIRAGAASRRLARLVACVATITWEGCPNAQAACLRENELLRLFRPKYNRVNTHPESNGYIGLRASGCDLELWLTREIKAGCELYGAFKSLRISASAGIVRLLWMAIGGRKSPDEFPHGLFESNSSRAWRVPVVADGVQQSTEYWVDAIRQYLAGASDHLLHCLREHLARKLGLASFWKQLLEADLETATAFYERGPKRNRFFQEQQGRAGDLISPAELDDLPVLTRAETESGS
jgi:hypothetical protein